MKMRSIPAGVAALVVVFAVGSALEMRATSGTEPANADGEPPQFIVSSRELPRGDRLDSRALRRGDRLDAQRRALNKHVFATRFASAFVASKAGVDAGDQTANEARSPNVSSQAPVRQAADHTAPVRVAAADAAPVKAAAAAPTRSLAPPEKSEKPDKPDKGDQVDKPQKADEKAEKNTRVASLEPPASPLPDLDDHTAIYDISAHTVYLPSGKKLEAHSGLGSHIDDPHSVRMHNRGATPPNVYRLALREHLFHGVRALRLIPVGDGNMFGRDGILAHSYMLGSKGQSNGCVAVRDYPAFLHAFLSGKVERLKVVAHLKTSDPRIASLQ